MAKPLGRQREVEHDEAKPAKGGKGKSFASSFDNAPASSVGIPPGKHEALIIGFELLEPNDKGQSVQIQYGIVNSDDLEGKTQKQFYKIMNDDDTVGMGAGFLKADLAKLGYDNVKFADLEDTLAEIAKEQPYVEILSKENKGYINIYLQGQLNQDDKPDWNH